MFLENWQSPITMLSNLIQEKRIPNIKIKLANDLLFSHKNSGNKHLVVSSDHKVFLFLIGRFLLFSIAIILLFLLITHLYFIMYYFLYF
jgi:hypothetical protein